MALLPASTKARAREAAKSIGGGLIGAATVGMLRTTRYFDPVKTSDFFARVTRTIGPRLREHRIGRANLTAAFPEKSPEEIEQILMGVWDNLGRVGAEFAHMDHVWDYDRAHPENSRIELPPRTIELFDQIRDDGKPALIFTSHLANWELPPSRTGSIPRSSIAGRTLPPPTASSRRCARSIWAR
jgi:Kdo2-lipid IVA lauroyltransferase/acyltransferase